MVTVADVARVSGVSTSTVSRVLSKRGYASPATREAVFSAAKRLGYVPNAIARGLKTQRSGFIAFIMPESLDPFFFSTLEKSSMRRCAPPRSDCAGCSRHPPADRS